MVSDLRKSRIDWAHVAAILIPIALLAIPWSCNQYVQFSKIQEWQGKQTEATKVLIRTVDQNGATLKQWIELMRLYPPHKHIVVGKAQEIDMPTEMPPPPIPSSVSMMSVERRAVKAPISAAESGSIKAEKSEPIH